MSAEQQARALMMRHHKMIKTRQQSMLGRAASEIGIDMDSVKYWGHIQGQPQPSFRNAYDRSAASLS